MECHETSNYSSVSPFYSHGGFNRCLSTLIVYPCVLVVCGVLLVWRSYQLRKNGSFVAERSLPTYKLIYVQKIVHFIGMFITIVYFITRCSVNMKIYLTDLISMLTILLVWCLSLWTLMTERTYHILCFGKQKYSVFSTLTWFIMLCIQLIIPLASTQSESWFFRGYTSSQPVKVVDLVFWQLLVYVSFCQFVLGIYSPASNLPSDFDLRPCLESSQTTSDAKEKGFSQGSTWKNAYWKLKKVFPYMWPRGKPLLQLYFLACFTLIILGRVVNVYVPIYSKLIVDSLSYQPIAQNSSDNDPSTANVRSAIVMLTDENKLVFRYDLILIYVLLKCLQGSGSSGFFNIIRSLFWVKIEQSTAKGIQLALFEHLHNLSIGWHLSKKTGEVITVMDRGQNSLQNVVNYLFFSIAPTFVDIIIAVIYFTSSFNAYFGLIVFVDMVLYLVITFVITEWRTKYRRTMNESANKVKAKSVDSLINFETVKYYGAADFELKRLEGAIDSYQLSEWSTQGSLALLNSMQCLIINAGLLAGSLLCAYYVVDGKFTVGDYVLFSSYIIQLNAPLNFIGTLYRIIQQSFIDMENMFDLMSEDVDVVDKPNAMELHISKDIDPKTNKPKQGQIIFENVWFSYKISKAEREDRKKSKRDKENGAASGKLVNGDDQEMEETARVVLRGVSFTVEPGKTLAIVGPSGSGKSTIVRLLFRFYDVNEGRILVDGVDIKDVTQESLRMNIGVVPQDTVLFNDSIEYNILYGKPRLTTSQQKRGEVHFVDVERIEESETERNENLVVEVAQMADLHDKIERLPHKYGTVVGERGLKLSGGEKQRVAIARTLLKNPRIVLLDEATSSLDTKTEKNIQSALKSVAANRTTLVIAHRLSTVVDADEILVLKDGVIVQRGTHNQLLEDDAGLYWELWNEQKKSANVEVEEVLPAAE